MIAEGMGDHCRVFSHEITLQDSTDGEPLSKVDNGGSRSRGVGEIEIVTGEWHRYLDWGQKVIGA